MHKFILCLCIGLIILGVAIFIIYLKNFLSGKCCEGCNSCNQKNNCSNFKRKNSDKKM